MCKKFTRGLLITRAIQGIRGKPLHLLADVGPPGSLTSRNKGTKLRLEIYLNVRAKYVRDFRKKMQLQVTFFTDASPAPIRQKRSTVMADNALPGEHIF